MLCGPGLYIPTAEKKLAALHSYLQVAEYLIPSNPSCKASHLWHDDLHDENIFVDPNRPTQILGIIDWQATQIAPLFDHRLQPSFLDYDGPDIDIEKLERPKFPDNLDGLTSEARARAISLYTSISVLIAFRRLVKSRTPHIYNVMKFQTTEPSHLLDLSKRLFEIGEAHVHFLLAGLKAKWTDIPAVQAAASSPRFPLSFSENQLTEIETDVEAATHGIELMEKFRRRLGELWPDKGVVRHEHYEETKARLRQLKDEALHEYARTEQDKALFELFWPFDD